MDEIIQLVNARNDFADVFGIEDMNEYKISDNLNKYWYYYEGVVYYSSDAFDILMVEDSVDLDTFSVVSDIFKHYSHYTLILSDNSDEESFYGLFDTLKKLT